MCVFIYLDVNELVNFRGRRKKFNKQYKTQILAYYLFFYNLGACTSKLTISLYTC
jgi:hypothetical protein